jgi:hypothetical protein
MPAPFTRKHVENEQVIVQVSHDIVNVLLAAAERDMSIAIVINDIYFIFLFKFYK